MSDKKQSAVEWLYDTIIIFPESIEDLAHNARSFKQAQQMEQEQNAESYKKGWDEGTDTLYKEVRKIYDANRIFYNIKN